MMARPHTVRMAERLRKDPRKIDQWSKIALAAFPALVLGCMALLFGLVAILLRLMKAQP